MKVVGISGTIMGSKTKIAMQYVMEYVRKTHPKAEVDFLDLSQFEMVFSDGRAYEEYEGDTLQMLQTIMEADALIIGSPTFQSSIPAPLKNVFDLLPVNGLKGKVVSLVVTADSPKHFLMAEQQIKPILIYLKATLVPSYVFIETKDYSDNKIVNEDVFYRLNKLVYHTVETLRAREYLKNSKHDSFINNYHE